MTAMEYERRNQLHDTVEHHLLKLIIPFQKKAGKQTGAR
jgi:hypothetical protein